MNGNVIKRVWAWIMVACMLFTMVPAFAEETAVEAPVETSAPAAVEETAEAPAETPAEPEAAPEEAEEPSEDDPADDTAKDESEGVIVPEDEPAVIEEYTAPEITEELVETEDVSADGATSRPTQCPEGTHVWDPSKTVVEVEGSCTIDREETRVCKVCGFSFRLNLGPQHNFQPVTLLADCTHGERTGWQCVNPQCPGNQPGATPVVDPAHPMVETGDPLGHKFEKELKNDPPTCEKDGERIMECINPNCPGNKVDGTDYPIAVQITRTPKLGHTPKDEPENYTLPATCEKNERLVYLCKVCGQVASTPDKPNGEHKLGHNFGTWETNPDDKDKLTHRRLCTHYAEGHCDLTKTNGYEIAKCQFVEIDRLPPTCARGTLIKSECKVCGNTRETVTGSSDPSKHVWSYFDPNDHSKELKLKCGIPTYVFKKCLNHTTPFEGGYDTVTQDHEWVVDHVDKATCVATGKRVEKCKYECGVANRETTLAIDPDNHSWGQPTTKGATCTEDESVVRYCQRTDADGNHCKAVETLVTLEGTALGHNYYDKDGKLKDDHLKGKLMWPTQFNPGQVDPLQPDKYKPDVANGYFTQAGYKLPTCTTDGLYTYQCDREINGKKCGDELAVTVVKLGHLTPAGGPTYKNRDCEQPDRYELTCARTGCGQAISITPSEGGRPASGHHEVAWTWLSGTTRSTSKHTVTCDNIWCNKPNHQFTQACTFTEVIKPATCHTVAMSVQKCTKCGKEIEEKNLGETFDPNNHDWGVGNVRTPATCLKDGVMEYTCRNKDCNAIKMEPIKGGCIWGRMSEHKDMYVDDGKHNDVEATCSTAGYYYEICLRDPTCNNGGTDNKNRIQGKKDGQPYGYRNVRKVSVPATGDHKYKAMEVQPAKCTQDATSSGFYCTECGQIDPNRKPGPIPGTAKGHQWDDGVVTIKATCLVGGEKRYTCTRPDCDGYDATRADNKDATGQTLIGGQWKAVKVVKTEPTEHTWSTTKKYYAADCIYPERWVTECEVCGLAKEPFDIVAGGQKALGHEFNKTPWRYLDNGKGTHGRRCTRCDKLFEVPCARSETAAATAANCTNPAGTTYTCYVCGHERFVASGTDKNPNNHVWELRVVNGFGPTCTDPGVGRNYCKLCNAVGSYESIPAAHNWGVGVVTTDATCDTDGVLTYTCSICNARKTEPIRAYGHAWDNGILTKQPTCTTPGIMTLTCQLCAATKEEETKPLDHAYVTNQPDDSGLATINYCKFCGTIEFVAWKDGITEEQKNCANVKFTFNGVVQTLDHDTEERDKIEPTKDKPGHQAGTYCKRCERYITGGEEIPYEHTEHVWVGAPVPDGSKSAMITYCVECGEIYTPLDPQNWIITEGRDCTKVYYEFNGEKHYAKHAELVTETEPGYTEGKKCPSCGMWVEGHEPAGPHIHEYEVEKYTRSTTNRKQKIAHVVCKGCDKTWDIEMGLSEKFDPSMITE